MIKEEIQQKTIYKFSLDTLQTIIGKNLILFEYYDHLCPLLRVNCPTASIQKKSNSSNIHNIQKQTISIVPVKQYFNINNKTDSLSYQPLPFPVTIPIVFSTLPQQSDTQSYPYQVVQQCLSSYKFISQLPPYMNSLLTTTNIGIVKQTLKIHMLLQTNIERSKALHRIKNIVNTLTLYQLQRNITQICSNFQELNNIFEKIGLICTKQQFQFYYNHVWVEIQEEQININSSNNRQGIQLKNQYIKRLQIFDILPLAVQLEQINMLKLSLRQWMGSQQFLKYHNNNNKYKVKEKYQKGKQRQRQRNRQQKDKDQIQNGSVNIQQNFNVLKLKIQTMGTMDLLQEIQKRRYDVEKHYKKFSEFRKGLLEEIQKQNEKKKIFNLINSKSTKSLSLAPNSNLQKNKSLISMNTNLTSMLQKYKPRQNRQKLQQQAFNKKVLNGFYIRQQIKQQISDGTKQYLVNQFGKDSDKWMEQITSINKDKRQSQQNEKNGKQTQKFKLTSRKKCGKIISNKQNKSVKQQKINQLNKPEPKRNRLSKLTSIQMAYTFNQFVPKQELSIKRQNKIDSQNYFNTLMNKITNQPFYRIGSKIFNK